MRCFSPNTIGILTYFLKAKPSQSVMARLLAQQPWQQQRTRTFLALANREKPFSQKRFKKCRIIILKSDFWSSKHLCTTGSQAEFISPAQVDDMLRKEQYSVVLKDSVITCVEVSHLASNRPSEDRWFAARPVSREGDFIFGVLDGHGGEMCAHNISLRLPNYVAAFLRPQNISGRRGAPSFKDLFTTHPSLVHDFRNDQLCQKSFDKLLSLRASVTTKEVTSQDKFVDSISEGLKKAFCQLDSDLHSEALKASKQDDVTNMVPHVTSVQSGCCALVSYISGEDLFVGNTGDCRAVAGVEAEDGSVSAKPLSLDQTAGNPHEVSRILKEHPDYEAGNLFSNGRLLGILTPVRAFGDAWLKWDSDLIKECFHLLYGPDVERLIPMFYDSPPYLTAEPEITHNILSSRFKFLILASDGLWDLIPNDEAVEFVKNHLQARGRDYSLDCVMMSGSDTSVDNVATALVRHALGGKNETKLAAMLSLPFPQVRMYRDDITVIVVLFND